MLAFLPLFAVICFRLSDEEKTITPSGVLFPDEVVAFASEVSKKKDIYEVLTLTPYEFCARINEVLQLKQGDAIVFFRVKIFC